MNEVVGARVATGRARRPARAEWRSVVALVCSVVLIGAGCTTTRTVYPTAAGAKAGLAAGDAVTVSRRDGRKLELTFVEWTPEGHFVGKDEAGILQTIEREELGQVQVRSTSAVRTILFVGAVVVVVGYGVAAAVVGDDLNY